MSFHDRQDRNPAKAPSEALPLKISARNFHGFETLMIQNSDRLDFHDVAVCAIRAALKAADAVGLAAAAKR